MSRGSSRLAYASLDATASSTSSATRRTGSLLARRPLPAAPFGRSAAVAPLISPQDRRAAAQAQAAGPVGGRHAALAVLLYVTQLDWRGRCAHEDPVTQRLELANRQRTLDRAAVPMLASRRCDRPQFDPAPVQLGPGARLGSAGPDQTADRHRGLMPVDPGVSRVDLWREADPGRRLLARRQLAGLDPVERRHHEVGARNGKPAQQVS